MRFRNSYICISTFVVMTLLLACCGWCATALSDNFTSNTIGSSWTVVDDPSPSCKSAWKMGGGTLTENSNIYRTSNEYSFWQGSHIVAGNSSWKNYEFSATCSSSDDDGWGLIVRYKDPNNYYRFITVADSGNKGPFRRLEKFVNGTRTVLAEDKSAFQTNKTYSVKISAVGSKLTLLIDGKAVLSATDSAFASGKVGFLTYANSGFTAKNVQVKTVQ